MTKYTFSEMDIDEVQVFKNITPRDRKNIQNAVCMYASRNDTKFETWSGTTKKGNLKLVVSRIA